MDKKRCKDSQGLFVKAALYKYIPNMTLKAIDFPKKTIIFQANSWSLYKVLHLVSGENIAILGYKLIALKCNTVYTYGPEK